MPDRSTASIANEWRALGAQRSDKDAFVRMLAGMDQPSTGYDTPALQGTTAKDGPTPRYNTDPKDAAIYGAQQNWRGIGEAALGVGDVTNDYLNAGIRDIGWLVGNNDPYQFPRPSEAAANLAADWTDTPDIDASKLPPSVQQEAANSRAMYGMIPTDVTDAASLGATGAAKLGILHGVPLFKDDAALARAANQSTPPLQQVDNTVGDINNPDVMFEGVSPHQFTDTEQWHRFGQAYGVPNLGSPDAKAWEAGLGSVTDSGGNTYTIPGGTGSTEPFTYYDLLHLKAQGINPNNVPPEMHQSIHDRFLSTMSPPGPVSDERLMNQLILGQISPNQPLSPNELAVGRTMAKGPGDIEKLGGMVPWRYDDPNAEAVANEAVGTKEVVNKKGETVTKDIKRRSQLSDQIANNLGLGAGSGGGLGARGTADYTRIAETAQRVKDDPDFFRFRGAGEMGGDDPNSAENWANFVERLSNQTPGLSSKTGSFSGVWQNPEKANISAVDRHMAGLFTGEMFDSPIDYENFKTTAVNRYRASNPGANIFGWEELPQSFKNDQLFGYLNNNPAMKYRGKPEKGSNSGEGPVNPRVPEHLQPDNARWVHEPDKVELISDPYKRVLAANAERANEAGQSTFGSQWMLWDRIRNRLEPHEIMFPGLEKLPRMSMAQMHDARQAMSDAGYMSGTKEIDPRTGEPKLQPVRPITGKGGKKFNPSAAAYFSLPAGAIMTPMLLEALQDREQEQRG